jgi:hypothetical protein
MMSCTARLPTVVCKRNTLLPTERVAGESDPVLAGGIVALWTAAVSVTAWAPILMTSPAPGES